MMLVAESRAHSVEGREKTGSGFAKAGQFPVREETQSSRERRDRLVHIRSDVPMDKQIALT